MTDKKERTPAQKAAQFQKGNSGNPAGRTPVPPEVKEAAKAHTMTAIDTLVDVMLNAANPSARVNASIAILNRGWGQPKQSVDVDVTHKQDWSALLNALDALDAHNAAKALPEVHTPIVIEGILIEAELANDERDGMSTREDTGHPKTP